MNQLSVALLGIGILLALGSPATAEQPAVMKIPAPALKKVDAWINSEAIKLQDLKGKVLVLHFWTHG